jgi:hypothetical protein
MSSTAIRAAIDDGPKVGDLVDVRGRKWVVGDDVEPAPTERSTLVTLQSVEAGEYGRSLDVLVRGGTVPLRAAEHVEQLIAAGVLVRLHAGEAG